VDGLSYNRCDVTPLGSSPTERVAQVAAVVDLAGEV
jgi:hypothetical protein